MPTHLRIPFSAITLFAVLAFSGGEAHAIAQSCKGKPRADRSKADAFFKGFQPKYTMGECMVRLKIDTTKAERPATVLYQIGKEFRHYLYTHQPQAAAHYFEPGADGFHYMLYVNQCPDRYAITQNMIDAVQPCFDGEATITMIKAPVEAGPETFEPTTTEWTDSHPE